ncbi:MULTISPECIES: hypothetical protein [unclassified Streptomyces]|uniref:hypothetical protein n=1 Tax=unclassified Streptomyces TaxID=2593676 RepID=UPI000FFE3A39|nr:MULTISPECIES: hypothetical protein [unclassified Streptomyces]
MTVLAPEPVETDTADEGITHVICCDDDTAICGTDVTGEPFVDDSVAVDCVVCLRTPTCPDCGRPIVITGGQ